MTVFFNFFKKSATKRLLAYRYGARKGNLTFFENRSSNRWLLSLYDVKEETFFNFNLTIRSCRSLYGAKKIFYSTVGSYGVAWVVRGVKRKSDFFHHQLSRMTLSFPIWYRKRKKFGRLVTLLFFSNAVYRKDDFLLSCSLTTE